MSSPEGGPAGGPRPTKRTDARLVALSVLSLYLELLLIRWMSSHVLYLGYFSNFVLLGCFLGLGAGALMSRRRWDLLSIAPFALTLLVALVLGTEIQVRIDSPDAIYFQTVRSPVQLPDYVVLPAVFLTVAGVFMSIGQALGRAIVAGPPLRQYTLNIVGSLIGIGLFTATAWLRLPAAVWFAVAAALLLPLLPRSRISVVRAGALVAVCAVVWRVEIRDSWSPYYRWRVIDKQPQDLTCELAICATRDGRPPVIHGPWAQLKVNSIIHQLITDYRHREPFYEFPYLALHRPPGRVAIIGAGNGTDTAFALAYGATHIDAVEIDPDIAGLGRSKNPSRPFADPRVRVIVDDGRAFLERSQDLYDLVIFGLPDSLTLASAHSSVRLESFLFTVEAFRAAKERLAPGGLLVLYNYYREPWLLMKLGGMLRQTFGRDPVILRRPGENFMGVLIAGDASAEAPPGLGREFGFHRTALASAPPVATDDWPFLYLRAPGVPAIYLRALGLIALATLLLLWKVAPRGAARRPDWTFLFMGVAFLLLETVSVVRFALVFGSTWLVNAVVFSLILVMVLGANLLCMRWKIRRVWPLVVALFAALALQAAVPLRALMEFEGVARVLVAGLLVFSPVFLANVLYSRTFRTAEAADRAYAWNLLGAMAGGLMEYAALWAGYTLLLGGVAVLYALALLSIAREPRAAARAG